MSNATIARQDVIEFFDMLASKWDAGMIRNDQVIDRILDNANVSEGKDVLDVACGTGVLIPDYLERKVASVTAVDISQEMIKIAKQKFTQENVHIICGDILEQQLDKRFDSIVVYNAFPHFGDPFKLIKTLTGLLKPGGYLTVAHGMSRAKIDHHHEGAASKVSCGLMSEDALAEYFQPELTVLIKISDESMYQVVGRLE